MAKSGKKRATVRGFKANGDYDTAFAAQKDALVVLREARVTRDPKKIEAAHNALDKAKTRYMQANALRFQHTAMMRGNTVVRNLDLLARLIGQRRYPVTEEHQRVVLAVIDGAMIELRQAFESAILRTLSSKSPVKRIQFGPLQLDPEKFLGKS